MGHRPALHRRLHQALADRSDSDRDDRQRLLPGLAVRTIPLGTGYAIWTGIGAVGAVSLSIYLFNESASPAKLIFIAIIMLGILGLKMTSDH